MFWLAAPLQRLAPKSRGLIVTFVLNDGLC